MDIKNLNAVRAEILQALFLTYEINCHKPGLFPDRFDFDNVQQIVIRDLLSSKLIEGSGGGYRLTALGYRHQKGWQ